MKISKLFSALVISGLMFATVADAASFGRSGGSSSGGSHSSSSSSPSFSRPSPSYSAPKPAPAPSVAPAPSRPGGVGGTSGSMGVRKSDVTAPVAQRVEQSRPSSPVTTKPGVSAPSPSYGSAPSPVYSAPQAPAVVNQGGGFGSALGGSFAGALGGTLIGNALFNNHGNGGGYSQPPVSGGSTSAAPAADANGVYQSAPVAGSIQPVQVKESYGMWHLMWDIISFAILVALVVGIAYLFYRGFKMVKGFADRERGVVNTQPFSPTAKFWEVQKAFAAADEAKLRTLLGPDLADEATQNLQVTEIGLSKVSHEVVLDRPREFSVHYTFDDNGETVNQVWHYEKFGSDWQLNGIETV